MAADRSTEKAMFRIIALLVFVGILIQAAVIAG
jgi:hypothetical protein